MNRPRSDQDVERALSDWMHDVVPSRPPVRLLEETFIATTQAAQDGARPWNRIDAGRPANRGLGSGPVLAVAIVVILIVAVFLVALVGGAPHRNAAPSPDASQPARAGAATPVAPTLPPPTSVTPEAVVGVDAPIAVAAGGQSLWILGPGRIDEVDPVANALAGSVAIGASDDLYNGIAATGDGVWATDNSTQGLVRVDPATRQVVGTTTVGLSPKGVLATPGGVFVADVHGGAVLRVDPTADKVVATISVGPTGPGGPSWLALGLGSLWVDIPNNGTVIRVSTLTDTVQATMQVPVTVIPCGGLAVGADAVWLTACGNGSHISRIDPVTSHVVASTDMGGNGYNPTLIGGAPWVSVDPGTADTGYLARVNPATNAIDRVLVPDGTFGGGGDIVVADGSVWVSDGYHNVLLRLPMSAFSP